MFSSVLVCLSLVSFISPAHALQPDEETWIGIEPIRHRSYHTAQQHRLRAQPQWKNFVEQTGWQIRFDEKTGFQTNHISNRKSGEWQKNFSDDEIKVLNGEFSQFLKDYGYD